MSTTLYMLGYIAWLLKDLIRSSSIFSGLSLANTVENLLTVLFFLLVLLALAQKPLSEKEFLVSLAVVGLALVSYTQNHYFYVVSSAICVVSCRNIDLKRVIRASYRLKTAWIAFHLTAYIIVYIVKPSMIRFDYRGGNTAIRHYFFLSQANTAAMLLAWTIIEFVYVNWDNSVLFPALAYGYLFLGQSFHAFFTVLDTLLTGRLLYGSFGLDQYGLTVLGQPITWAGIVYWKGYWIDQVVFDNAYLYFAVALGIIWLIILSFSFFRVERYLTVTECILVTIYILFAITENYTVDVVYCFPMLFVSRLIFGMDGAGAEALYAAEEAPSETEPTLFPEAGVVREKERKPEPGIVRARSISNELADLLPKQEKAAGPGKLRAETRRIRSEIRAEMKKADREKLSSDDADHAARWRTEAETEKENEEWLAKWRIQRHE